MQMKGGPKQNRGRFRKNGNSNQNRSNGNRTDGNRIEGNSSNNNRRGGASRNGNRRFANRSHPRTQGPPLIRLVEITANSLEEARVKANKQFLFEDETILDFEIVEKGKKSFFGLGPQSKTYKFSAKPEYEQIIRSYLNRIIEASRLGVTFDVAQHDSLVTVNIFGDDEELFTEHDGELLLSMEHLFRKFLKKLLPLTREFKLQFNCNDFLQNRENTLEKIAQEKKDEVINSGAPVVLEPLPPSDRRIIHQYLHDDKVVITSSLGEGHYKRIKINLV